jgi:hypothetical protein
MGLDTDWGSKKLQRGLLIWLSGGIKLQKTRLVWVWEHAGFLKSFTGAAEFDSGSQEAYNYRKHVRYGSGRKLGF